MCFYCWEFSPRNGNDRKDAYYRMTICCFSKNILSAIIWLFAIRFIFDLIFSIIFSIFEIPLFLFLTLSVGFALILGILGFKLKLLWIYYIFGIFTIILLILDFGSLSYIIYSLVDGNGWLYNYAHKHISTKSDESLFEISDRKYTATDLILIIFAIFLLISVLHDFTNLLMIHRSLQYLKRFYSSKFNKTSPRIQMESSNRNRLNSIQAVTNGRYIKRPSDLSLPSIVAPQIGSLTPRPSYIDIYQEPITPKVTTIIHRPQHQNQNQQPQHQQPHQHSEEIRSPEVLINDGYSFIGPIHPRRTVSNIAATTPEYEIPETSRIDATQEYISPRHQYEGIHENQRIQEQDTRNPFGNDSKKDDLKIAKSQPIQPNEVPPLPPKSITQSTKSQTSESNSYNYENTLYNNFEQQHHITIPSSFVPIPFNSNSNNAENIDSRQEFDGFDSSFEDEQLPPSNWDTEETTFNATVQQHQHQAETNYSNINPVLSTEKYEDDIQQQPPHWNTNIASSSSVTNDEIYLPKVAKNQSQIIYSNKNPVLSPPPPPPNPIIDNSSNERRKQYSNHINDIPAKKIFNEEDENDDDDDDRISHNSNDVVSFWSKHPSTRRRRASKDLLNEKGFLTDSSEEVETDEKGILPLSTNKSSSPPPQKPPLKSYGLTQILKLEKGEHTKTTTTSGGNENRNEISSDIFALKSIKVMKENDKNSSREYQTIKTTTIMEDKKTEKIEERDYGISSYHQQESKIMTHLNYENLPDTSVEDSNAFSSLKRDSLSLQPNEIRKSESYETPITHFPKIFEVKKQHPSAMTPETPIIPSTSNFFDAWGKAADQNTDESKTSTVPFNLRNAKIDKFEGENIVTNARQESKDSDSTMNFSSSSDEDSESDFDTRYEKLKQKLQAHLPQKIIEQKAVTVKNESLNGGEASSSHRNDTVINIESISSEQEEQIQFRRLPLIGNSTIDRSPAT